MRHTDFRNAAVSGGRLPAGAYVCKIQNVTDFPEKEYLKIEFDVAEGSYANHYTDLGRRWQFWPSEAVLFRSYKDSALGMFHAFVQAVEASNKGYIFDDDELTLRGKLVGIALGEEEFLARDGTIKTRLKADRCASVSDVRAGKVATPPAKKLSPPVKRELEKEVDVPF